LRSSRGGCARAGPSTRRDRKQAPAAPWPRRRRSAPGSRERRGAAPPKARPCCDRRRRCRLPYRVRLDEEDVAVPGRPRRLEDEDAIRLHVAGEVVEVAPRPEAVEGVVRADLLVAGRNDEQLTREERGE